MAGTLVVSNLNDGTNSVGLDALIKSGVRAWVNMTGAGVIRASSNVSSVTLLATGKYQVNFINPMPHENYACSGFASWNNDSYAAGLVSGFGSHKANQKVNSALFFCTNSTSGGIGSILVNDIHFLVVA